MSIRTPAQVFPPGEFIRDELEERGWTQADLAKIMGRPAPAINLIISGKKGITPETAVQLSAAFGTSPEFWLGLESAYRLSALRKSDQSIRERAEIFGAWPVKEMEERKWIRQTGSVEQLRAELADFSSISSDPNLKLQVAARAQARTADALTPEQQAWCFQVLRMANKQKTAAFDAGALGDGIVRLRALAKDARDVGEVPRTLAEMGIRFVIVKHLAKTKIDGAALWLGDSWKKPLIALSLRHDRIDYFWHTLYHELAHIMHRDTYVVDDDLHGSKEISNEQRARIEKRADSQAAEMLVPKKSMDTFVARTRPYYSKQRIVEFADHLEIHPGIVAGQLQHRGETFWSANREMLVKVREVILRSAPSDGW